MSETIPPVPVMCECGNQIYEEVYFQGIVLVHAGGGLLRDLRGNCAQCGKKFWWSIKDQQISRAIVERKRSDPGGGHGE
jgi:hypothetical protein